MGGFGYRAGHFGIVGPILGLLLFLGLLAMFALGILWLVRLNRATRRVSARGAGTAMGTPLETARRRLAAGEITLEEYDRIREALREDS